MPFLPITREECLRLGWDAPDFVLVVGEAYVDHPSFGQAIIGRVLENAGYRVAMLCLPEYRTDDDFKRFGRPRLGFLVTAGVIDSMVNHFTSPKSDAIPTCTRPAGRRACAPTAPRRSTATVSIRLFPARPS
jgi:hypothetical protein